MSLASLALGNQPPPPPFSSAQTQMHSLTLSLYIRRVRYAKIICYPRAAPRAPLSCFAWELALTLKADKVAGLFGLPSDDAQAVLQAQYVLHAKNETACVPDWHLHLVSDQITSSLGKYTLLSCHLGEVKIVGVGLLASQTHRDEDDHGSV